MPHETDSNPQGANPADSARTSRKPNGVARRPMQHAVTERCTVWLTGLPGSGKTTIARSLETLLHQLGSRCCVLDGDELRNGLSSDLGLSRDDRREQARRVAHVAAVVARSGVIPIVALVSPYALDRALARDIHDAEGVRLLEVWVDTPLHVCVARDPKGLYAAHDDANSHRGKMQDGSGLTGVSAPYEAPKKPDLRIAGDGESPRAAAIQIIERLVSSSPPHTGLR